MSCVDAAGSARGLILAFGLGIWLLGFCLPAFFTRDVAGAIMGFFFLTLRI